MFFSWKGQECLFWDCKYWKISMEKGWPKNWPLFSVVAVRLQLFSHVRAISWVAQTKSLLTKKIHFFLPYLWIRLKAIWMGTVLANVPALSTPHLRRECLWARRIWPRIHRDLPKWLLHVWTLWVLSRQCPFFSSLRKVTTFWGNFNFQKKDFQNVWVLFVKRKKNHFF